jgi:pimeloyl-ACP methyl ester carboxylesterase
MSKFEKITLASGLTFDALASGEAGHALVLLLHGFAESMNCWRAQLAALAANELSRHCTEPARLFAGRAARCRRARQLSYRPSDGRRDGDRRRLRLWRPALSSDRS